MIDLELMDKLLTERLNPSQQRFMRRLRDRVAAGSTTTPTQQPPPPSEVTIDV
jgi:hypothetical protein